MPLMSSYRYHIILIDCGELSVENGEVHYTNLFLIGSVATFTCNEGYVSNNRIQVCTTDGWSGSDFTCQS